ncbi:MAG: hypothetical protein ACI9BD_000583, partial [Candidatus Marinamargulisbacteria bacterium]
KGGIIYKRMKKLIGSLIIGCIFSAVVFGAVQSACGACLTGHSDMSKNYSVQSEPVAEMMSCHSQEVVETCDVPLAGASTCQLCIDADFSAVRLDVVSSQVVDDDSAMMPELLAIGAVYRPSSPSVLLGYSVKGPPQILSAHLTVLASIKLLI